MVRQFDLNDIRLLMQVIEHGSYTAASRATGVPKSTISQRIAALEQMIGTGLLRRTSRSFSLTEAGARLLPQARAIENLARQMEISLFDQGSELQGTLRLSCSNAIAQYALSPLVPRFLNLHKSVTIRVEASNRLIDLVADGFDLTVRGHVGPLKDSSLLQRVVARAPWSLVASPAWIEEHGMPATPFDIPAGEVLCFSTAADCPDWVLTRGEEEVSVSVQPRLISDDMATIRASAIADGGITSLPTYILRAGLRSGQLVPVLPAWSSPTSTLSVLSPPRGQSSRLAASFSDFLAIQLPRLMLDRDAPVIA